MTLAAIDKPQKKNVFEAILARRSVRTYAPDQLGRNTVQTLLEAAVRAPTAMHEEPWAFVVVQDHALLQRLSELAKPIFVEEVRHRNSQGASHSFDHFTRPVEIRPGEMIERVAGSLRIAVAHLFDEDRLGELGQALQ